MALENPMWGAPRIHGKLTKLRLHASERSVQRSMPKRLRVPERSQTWRTSLENHRDVLAAMDFCVVPALTFGLLYVLVVVDHGRRVIQHFYVTAHPTKEWVKAQFREAFPCDEIPEYLIFDWDTTFSAVKNFVRAMGITPKQTSFYSPWQNGTCKRLIGTLRCDLLDHVVPLNESHLRRLLRAYVSYYHHDRTHLALNKDSRPGRPLELNPSEEVQIEARARIGG